MSQLAIVIKPTGVKHLVFGDKHRVVKATTCLNYLDVPRGQGSIDPWCKLVAKVTLAELPVVITTHSVHQMVIKIIGILSNYNGVIIATAHTKNLNVILDVTQDHLWLTNV